MPRLRPNILRPHPVHISRHRSRGGEKKGSLSTISIDFSQTLSVNNCDVAKISAELVINAGKKERRKMGKRNWGKDIGLKYSIHISSLNATWNCISIATACERLKPKKRDSYETGESTGWKHNSGHQSCLRYRNPDFPRLTAPDKEKKEGGERLRERNILAG